MLSVRARNLAAAGRIASRPVFGGQRYSNCGAEYHGDPGPSTAATMRRLHGNAAYRQRNGEVAISTHLSASSTDPSLLPTRSFSTYQPSLNLQQKIRSNRRLAHGSAESARRSGTNKDDGRVRRAPARNRIPGYAGALTRRNEPGLRFEDAPSFVLSQQLKEFVRRHPHPMASGQLKQAIALVRQAPSHLHNSVVWNQILHIVGREGNLELMWKLYNDMKKRGIKPTMKTFSTMINSYVGLQHDRVSPEFTPKKIPTSRQVQRVVELYNQSQAYISEQVVTIHAQSKRQAKDGAEPNMDSIDMSEINLAPTNAYLKFLSKYGMWSQVEKVRLALDKEGPLAPDNITYTTLFMGMLNRLEMESEGAGQTPLGGSSAGSFNKRDLGENAREMWEALVRQFHPAEKPKTNSTEPKSGDRLRVVDSELALAAMQCLLSGRSTDSQLALDLIPYLWNIQLPDSDLPAPASMARAKAGKHNARDAKNVPKSMINLPELPINIRSATAITSMLAKHKHRDLASKYAEYFLHLPSLALYMDYPFLRVAIWALSMGGNVRPILQIMDSHQPPTGSGGWPMYVWEDAVFACRSSGKFETALGLVRRMTHLPHGVESGKSGPALKPYKWSLPNGLEIDIRGKKWHRPNPMQPSAKVMATFIETALNSSEEAYIDNLRKAYRVLQSFDLEKQLTLPDMLRRQEPINLLKKPTGSEAINSAVLRAAEWPMSLVKDIRKLTGTLIKSREQPGQAIDPELVALRDRATEVIDTWGPVFGKSVGKGYQAVGKDIQSASAREFYKKIQQRPRRVQEFLDTVTQSRSARQGPIELERHDPDFERMKQVLGV